MSKTIVAIPDLHSPFIHKGCVDFIFKIIRSFQPQYIVVLGDAVDFYSLSRFPRSHFMTPTDEYIQGRKCLEEIFGYIKKISPKSEIHLIMGNHDMRALKKTQELSPELEMFVSKGIKEYFTFPEVITHHDYREPLEIDGILFVHGWLSGIGKHCQYFKRSVVHGHTHKASIYYETTYEGNVIFEADSGFAADPSAKVMGYYPSKYNKSVLGCTLITDGRPQFLAYIPKK